jgi:hypothetical protein
MEFSDVIIPRLKFSLSDISDELKVEFLIWYQKRILQILWKNSNANIIWRFQNYCARTFCLKQTGSSAEESG